MSGTFNWLKLMISATIVNLLGHVAMLPFTTCKSFPVKYEKTRIGLVKKIFTTLLIMSINFNKTISIIKKKKLSLNWLTVQVVSTWQTY